MPNIVLDLSDEDIANALTRALASNRVYYQNYVPQNPNLHDLWVDKETKIPHIFDGNSWVLYLGAEDNTIGALITIGPTPPSSPSGRSIWFSTIDFRPFVFNSSAWIQM